MKLTFEPGDFSWNRRDRLAASVPGFVFYGEYPCYHWPKCYYAGCLIDYPMHLIFIKNDQHLRVLVGCDDDEGHSPIEFKEKPLDCEEVGKLLKYDNWVVLDKEKQTIFEKDESED